MEPIHSIPYLPEEQSRLQFAKNCIDTLSYLEVVMDDIFNSISSRISESSEKITKLKSRAESAQRKVDQLKGRSNATQVFCSPNFPGRSNYEPFKSLFSETEQQFFTLKKYDDVAIEPQEVNKKSNPFIVVGNHWKQLHKQPKSKSGIGKLPSHINSVSSTLLYNTPYNVYENYRLVDPLSLNYENRIEMGKNIDQNLLAEAPMSITNLDHVSFTARDDFHYLPDLTDLPEIDLPLELPSLPGIANDLLYEGDAGPDIAPSYFLPDLPQELETVPEEVKKMEIMTSDTATNEGSAVGHDVTETKSDIFFDKEPKTLPTAIPPPPPLPEALMVPRPPPLPEFLIIPPPPMMPSNAKNEIEKIIPPAASSDTRSSLMKAIQEAGGMSKAKLKKVGLNDQSKTKEPPKPASSGDYMSDLFSKLAQRRKGISGSGANKENAPKKNLSQLGTLQQMSALIPPPPKSSDESEKISEDDWD